MQLRPERVRHWRHARLLTQQELADKAGLGLWTISAMETGQVNPRFRTIKAVAAALCIEPEELIEIEEVAG